MKNRILVFASHYLPGHNAGGPIRSLESIFNCLSEDIDFYLVTSDRDLGDNKPYPGIDPNSWTTVGNVSVFYSDQKYISKRRLLEIFERVQPQTVYVNSLFSFAFSIRILFFIWHSRYKAVRVVLAPRGELSKGALDQKRLKKFGFTLVTKFLKLYKNMVWHVSSKYEFLDVEKTYGDFGQIHIASNLVNDEASKLYSPLNEQKIQNEINIIFISRISRKKNLDFAIRSLLGLDGKVIFDIYGPHEDLDYVSKCKGIALDLPDNVSVCFKGDIEHENVPDLFKKYDIFYLPTKGENFGQVIWESLSCGCPVLISDQTPWSKVEADGVGWALPLLHMDAFTDVLQGIIDNDPNYSLNRKSIHRYALGVANTSESITANRQLFTNGVEN